MGGRRPNAGMGGGGPGGGGIRLQLGRAMDCPAAVRQRCLHPTPPCSIRQRTAAITGIYSHNPESRSESRESRKTRNGCKKRNRKHRAAEKAAVYDV